MNYPSFLSPHVFPADWPLLGNIRWYGVMYLVAVVITYYFLRARIKKGTLAIPLENKGGLYDLLFFLVVGLIVGARLGFFIFYHPDAFIFYPWEIIGIHIREGQFAYFGFDGMSYHGGMLGVIASVILFARTFKYDFYSIADAAAVSVPLGLFFGRMGNFLNAELYGRETTFFLGMKFPRYDAVGGFQQWLAIPAEMRPFTQPRHPSQLYEAFLEGILLFMILFIASKMKLRRGIVFWLYITFYGLFRFLVEFVRDPNEWRLGWLTAGMAYSFPMFLLGVGMIAFIKTRKSL
ncbi:MAG: prolipoprotein diacylglyceryl transferase [Spirochaetota bacterium]